MKIYSSFNSFEQIAGSFDLESPLKGLLKEKDKYLAHKHRHKPKETLDEHMKLVIQYFLKLVNAHGLDFIVDELIQKAIPAECDNSTAGNFVKSAFFKVILYHDFGKINHLFQWDKDKMANAEKDLKVVNHKVGTQHSIISAYIYLVHLLNNEKLGFDDATQSFTDFISTVFSYSIIKHHSSRLNKVQEIDFQGSVDVFREYLPLFDLPEPSDIDELHALFESPSSISNSIEYFYSSLTTDPFAIYALLKLNFSLLTASDYYATGEYSQDLCVTDFGLLSKKIRQHIIHQFRASKEYNQALFEDAEKYKNIPFQDLQERNNQNLNILRQKLATEALGNLKVGLEHKNIFYLEAPTGGGKTNISLALITELLEADPQLNKVFYVFPFTTLITQTFQSIKDTLNISNEHIIQLHAKSGFHQREEEAKDGVYGNKRLDFLNNHFVNYPITLLSHIKFFDILKGNSKSNNYLYHRLANSVVVIDELQTYTPKHWDKVIYFLSKYANAFNMKVILMSATLPKIDELLEEDELKNQVHSLISADSKIQFFQNPNFAGRVEFDFSLLEECGWKRPKGVAERGSFLDRLAQKVAEEAQAYASAYSEETDSVRVLIEFITKKSASKFFRLLEEREEFTDYQKHLISGEILDPRRQQIIEEIKSGTAEKVILVTTQVVEAGVDIDMDLGFKDRSLIDSDEQLAGRVNRNAKKDGCKVFMFDLDGSSFIYKGDKRLEVKPMTQRELYQKILITKDFDTGFYKAVNSDIKKQNSRQGIEGITDYQRHLKSLNFHQVNKQFQLIEQENASIFVPLPIPKEHFHPEDLTIIELLAIPEIFDHQGRICISGVDIWDAYNKIVTNQSDEYIMHQIALKRIYGIVSKFMFSSFESQINTLLEFCDNGEGFEDYRKGGLYYLLHWDKIYSYEGGINMESIKDDGVFL